MIFNLEIPINSLSLGQIGYGVAYEMYKRGLEPNIFLIGAPDFRSFDKDDNFNYWLTKCVNKAQSSYKKTESSISLWHINGSHKRLTDNSILWTVHETDSITETEFNILEKYNKVLVTSQHTKNLVSERIDCDLCPNYFDHLHFRPVDTPTPNEAITFGLFGKVEKRKNTRNIIISWCNKFGGNKDYRLVCQVFNPFIDPNVQTQEIQSWFGGRQVPWNVSFLPFQEKNSDFNKVLNSVDIDLSGLSGAEGWGLPCFTKIALGGHSIVLNGHGHKEFATEENSILLEPTGEDEIYDGIFFQKGAQFNQGNMKLFSQDAVHAAYDKALDKLKKYGKLNEAGFQLQQKFSVGNTVDKLLSYV